MGPRNSAAEILQQRGRYARHEKSPARARNGSCRVMVSNPRDKDMIDAGVDAEKLKLGQQELSIEAQKEGVKIAIDKQNTQAKLDLEIAKLMEESKEPKE